MPLDQATARVLCLCHLTTARMKHESEAVEGWLCHQSLRCTCTLGGAAYNLICQHANCTTKSFVYLAL